MFVAIILQAIKHIFRHSIYLSSHPSTFIHCSAFESILNKEFKLNFSFISFSSKRVAVAPFKHCCSSFSCCCSFCQNFLRFFPFNLTTFYRFYISTIPHQHQRIQPKFWRFVFLLLFCNFVSYVSCSCCCCYYVIVVQLFKSG